jgi:hypothetical protein
VVWLPLKKFASRHKASQSTATKITTTHITKREASDMILLRNALILVLGLAGLIGGGLLNEKNFQRQFDGRAKYEVRQHFEEKNEKVIGFEGSDYSLGQLEMSVRTERGHYYVVVSDETSLLFRHTAFNLVMPPVVSLRDVQASEEEALPTHH